MHDMSGGPHIIKRFDEERSHLRQLALEMGHKVHQQMADALEAIRAHNLDLARQVTSGDALVDQLEVLADRALLDLIARNSPLGSDLRELISLSKCTSELEKIGDEAARIADLLRGEISADQDMLGLDPALCHELDCMAAQTLSHLQAAVALLAVWDETQARRIIATYHDINRFFEGELKRLMSFIKQGEVPVGQAITLVLVAKYLERATHHAVNLAEYRIFEAKGVLAAPEQQNENG